MISWNFTKIAIVFRDQTTGHTFLRHFLVGTYLFIIEWTLLRRVDQASLWKQMIIETFSKWLIFPSYWSRHHWPLKSGKLLFKEIISETYSSNAWFLYMAFRLTISLFGIALSSKVTPIPISPGGQFDKSTGKLWKNVNAKS